LKTNVKEAGTESEIEIAIEITRDTRNKEVI
jgi:hypothetical protein